MDIYYIRVLLKLFTNKIGTRLFRLAVLLKALNTIYKTASLLISNNLIIII